MRRRVLCWMAVTALGSSAAFAAVPVPILLGMHAVELDAGRAADPAELWPVAGTLRARGVDLDRLPALTKAFVLRAVPSYPPAFGPITSPFGRRPSPFTGEGSFHRGLDIGARFGAGVYAVSDGRVTRAGWDAGLGRSITLDLGAGLVVRYGHLSRLGTAAGARVRRGELLGRVGSTGRSTGSHLHYEVKVNGSPVDPARFFLPRGQKAPWAGTLTVGGLPLLASAAPASSFLWR